MAQENKRVQTGRELAAMVSSYKGWPSARVSEAGICQLRSRRGKDRNLNRHYAVSGPSAFDIDRSYRSSEIGGSTPLYAMMDFIEYGQYEGSECIMALSTLRAQIKINHLEHCRKGLMLSQEPQRYLKMRGKVHRVCDFQTIPIFCSDDSCRAAEGEPNNGMYRCGMVAAPEVVEASDRIEILYDSLTDTGRILGVVHAGNTRVSIYSYVPEKFIAGGGFANVTLDVICARTN